MGYAPGLFLRNIQLWNIWNKASCHTSPSAYASMSLIAVCHLLLPMIKLALSLLQLGHGVVKLQLLGYLVRLPGYFCAQLISCLPTVSKCHEVKLCFPVRI